MFACFWYAASLDETQEIVCIKSTSVSLKIIVMSHLPTLIIHTLHFFFALFDYCSFVFEKTNNNSNNSNETTNNQQQTTNNKHPTTNNQQQTTNNNQPTTNNQQQTTNNKQPTINNQQQTTNNKQPTTNNKQHTITNELFVIHSIAWSKLGKKFILSPLEQTSTTLQTNNVI